MSIEQDRFSARLPVELSTELISASAAVAGVYQCSRHPREVDLTGGASTIVHTISKNGCQLKKNKGSKNHCQFKKNKAVDARAKILMGISVTAASVFPTT